MGSVRTLCVKFSFCTTNRGKLQNFRRPLASECFYNYNKYSNDVGNYSIRNETQGLLRVPDVFDRIKCFQTFSRPLLTSSRKSLDLPNAGHLLFFSDLAICNLGKIFVLIGFAQFAARICTCLKKLVSVL